MSVQIYGRDGPSGSGLDQQHEGGSLCLSGHSIHIIAQNSDFLTYIAMKVVDKDALLTNDKNLPNGRISVKTIHNGDEY